ncbi:MAG: metallophosphoesterase [Gemmatimonadaceae bacterium]|nr:metallophosphoesterase [Gemmatimonadaceae bacterium]
MLTICLATLATLAATVPVAQYSGTVFVDSNGNGVRDRAEVGVVGVAVSNQESVVLTDRDGRYTLSGRGQGQIFVSLPRGYRSASWWKSADSVAPVDFALTLWREPVPFRFAQASDTHIAPAVVARTRRMISLIDSIGPAMLLITGDLVRDALRVSESEATSYYTLFADELRALKTPWHTVPGNHEMFGIERTLSKVEATHPLFGKQMYRHYHGPEYYSFNAGGLHFVALNTVDIDGQWYYGHVDSVQLAWLRQDLAAVPDTIPVVTFSHIPLVSASEGLGGYTEAPPAPTLITVNGRTQFRHIASNVEEVLAAIAPHRLEIALAGHIHYRELVTMQSAQGPLRFFQTAAVVGDVRKGGTVLPSGITVYTVRRGHVDDGQAVPLGKIP